MQVTQHPQASACKVGDMLCVVAQPGQKFIDAALGRVGRWEAACRVHPGEFTPAIYHLANAGFHNSRVQRNQVVKQGGKNRFLPRHNAMAVGSDINKRMLGLGNVKRGIGQRQFAKAGI